MTSKSESGESTIGSLRTRRKVRLIEGGFFTKVSRAEREPVPRFFKDGVAVKEYLDDKDTLQALFGAEWSAMSVEERRKELERRQFIVQNYFRPVLPKLVVRKRFFITEDAETDARRRVLVEVQPFITPPFVDLSNFCRSIDNSHWSGEYEGAMDDALARMSDTFIDGSVMKFIAREIGLFVKRAAELPEYMESQGYSGRIIDIRGQKNLIAVPGGLRMIDTNCFLEQVERGRTYFNSYGAEFRRFLGYLNNLKVKMEK